ncbi:MAG: hypothetical protein WDN47_04295 [Candidatus Doudnabacteria bacterium]
MKINARFPKAMPAVGSLVRFTTSENELKPKEGNDLIEAIIISRWFDSATGLFYATTSNLFFQDLTYNPYRRARGWESSIGQSEGKEFRKNILQLRVLKRR